MKFICQLSLILFTTSCFAATDYTTDKIDGVAVINRLDITDLEPGKIHRFYFRGASNGIGQHWFIPILVSKGSKPGKTLGIQAGTHGDELNGTNLLHKLFAQLDPKQQSGNVIAVVGANSTGLLNNSRYFQLQGNTSGGVDFNRIWPGDMNSDSADIQAGLLWSQLWAGNVNYFIDLHTQSTGTEYPLYIFSDFRNKDARIMAELIPADQIKMDPGQKGTVETTFIEHNIPAITLEIGAPKKYQKDLIDRSLVGINNILINYKILNGKIGATSKTQKTFIGNETIGVPARAGGFTELMTGLNHKVSKGQLLAIQRNGFGDIIERYYAPSDGHVLSIATDPLREPGSMIVRLLIQNPDAECSLGC